MAVSPLPGLVGFQRIRWGGEESAVVINGGVVMTVTVAIRLVDWSYSSFCGT